MVVFSLLALFGSACERQSEIVARERTSTGGALAGGGGAGGASGGSATTGGASSFGRPLLAPPSPVSGLNDPLAKDQDPTLTEDQLEIFFFSDRDGKSDIWTSTRRSSDADWEPPVPVPELNSAEDEQNPAISYDGLSIWFFSKRGPSGIYVARRATRMAPFDDPELVPVNSGEDPDAFPIAPSVDAAELRMALSIGASTTRDLYEMVRPSTVGSWGEPALLLGINGDHVDSTPFLVGDGREMLFHSGRSGSGDLFWAHRASPGLPFTQVEPLSELNDPGAFESHPHLTSDRRWLYFGSDRTGNTDIYVAEVVDE